MQTAQPLGIDNLVAIAVDGISVAKSVAHELEDGFQPLRDVPTIAFGNFGKLQNIGSKAKQAWAEIKNLEPEEIEDFELRVANQADITNEGVYGKVRASLRLVARTYKVIRRSNRHRERCEGHLPGRKLGHPPNRFKFRSFKVKTDVLMLQALPTSQWRRVFYLVKVVKNSLRIC